MADNKSTYSSLMNELVDVINEKANASDSKNLEELVATAKTIVKPEGTLEITENKQYDVSGYALANVNVASSGGGSLKALLDYSKSMKNMFYQNTNIIDMSGILDYNDTENVEETESCFNGCTNLEILPTLNFSKAKHVRLTFNKCKKLTEVSITLQECTSFYYSFTDCSKITKITINDTSKVTSFDSPFDSCKSLVSLSTIDLINATYVKDLVYGCENLVNLTIKNIKINLQIGGTFWSEVLSVESLLNACQECINVNASRTLTVGSANMTKLSSVYVKLTNEPEVDSTLPKLPMVQCESTDEGAMLVADYMALKKWSLA